MYISIHMDIWDMWQKRQLHRFPGCEDRFQRLTLRMTGRSGERTYDDSGGGEEGREAREAEGFGARVGVVAAGAASGCQYRAAST
jgi:hypothetical protein